MVYISADEAFYVEHIYDSCVAAQKAILEYKSRERVNASYFELIF
jgi:hypothetical protein